LRWLKGRERENTAQLSEKSIPGGISTPMEGSGTRKYGPNQRKINSRRYFRSMSAAQLTIPNTGGPNLAPFAVPAAEKRLLSA
jgi:hypothetical protein